MSEESGKQPALGLQPIRIVTGNDINPLAKIAVSEQSDAVKIALIRPIEVHRIPADKGTTFVEAALVGKYSGLSRSFVIHQNRSSSDRQKSHLDAVDNGEIFITLGSTNDVHFRSKHPDNQVQGEHWSYNVSMSQLRKAANNMTFCEPLSTLLQIGEKDLNEWATENWIQLVGQWLRFCLGKGTMESKATSTLFSAMTKNTSPTQAAGKASGTPSPTQDSAYENEDDDTDESSGAESKLREFHVYGVRKQVGGLQQPSHTSASTPAQVNANSSIEAPSFFDISF